MTTYKLCSFFGQHSDKNETEISQMVDAGSRIKGNRHFQQNTELKISIIIT